MRRFLILTITLLITLPAGAQVRQKKSGPADFDQLLKKGGEAFHAEDYGVCITNLKDAIAVVAAKQHGAILATMPPAPAGFTKQAVSDTQSNPLAGAMAGSIGLVVEQAYSQDNGGGHISVTVTANSPMVGMIEAAFQMAGFNPEVEVVQYDQHKALFQTEENGKRLELQLPLFGKHYLEVRATGLDEDTLFNTFNQKFVDELARVMGQ